jgi:hypothetical protein
MQPRHSTDMPQRSVLQAYTFVTGMEPLGLGVGTEAGQPWWLCAEPSGCVVLCDWWTTLRWTVGRALPHARRRRLRAKRSAGGSPSGSPGRCGHAGCKGANGVERADHCTCGHCADGAPTGARTVPPRGGGLRCELAVREGSMPDSWAASLNFVKLHVAATHAELLLIALLTGGSWYSSERLNDVQGLDQFLSSDAEAPACLQLCGQA